MKKLIALVLALAMVATLGLAFAADITVENADNGQTYTAYKLLDYAYNASTDTFTYYIEDDDEYAAINALNLGFTFADDATYGHVVTNAGDLTAAGLTTALKGVIGDDLDDAALQKVTTTAANNAATLTGLEAGYWFVTSTTGTLVSLQSFNQREIVFDKNEVPSIDKEITGATDGGVVADDGETADVNVGSVITYEVTVAAKKGAINYIFHDSMDAGLTFLPSEGITVKVGGTEVDPSNYNIAYSSATAATAASGDVNVGDNLTIRFHNTYLKSLFTGNTTSVNIVVSYKAQVNEDAVIGQTGNDNSATLEYGHTPGSEDDEDTDGEPSKITEETKTTVYTYAIALKKVDKNGAALADAVFSLPFYVKALDANGNYIYAGTTAGTGLVNSITTTNNGTITIQGVKSGSYTVNETAAPTGYNKVSGDITVDAVKTSESVTTTSITKYLDKDGNVVATEQSDGHSVTYTNNEIPVGAFSVVVNLAGAELPSTGGIGTTIFYILGGLLVVGAAVILVARRKASN